VKNAPTPVRRFVVRCDSIADIDYSSAKMLGELIGRVKTLDADLVLADVRPDIAELLERYGLSKVLGPTRVFLTIEAALSDYKSGKE